ncbi:MAG: hypothetical protein NTU54_04470 [Candidatus Omnitrophica bacterium]|nr:hypothetical protein [Candidatus Omnitrophota bacterium]
MFSADVRRQQQLIQSKTDEGKANKEAELKLRQRVTDLEKSLAVSKEKVFKIMKERAETEQKLILTKNLLARSGKENSDLQAQAGDYLKKINSLKQQLSAAPVAVVPVAAPVVAAPDEPVVKKEEGPDKKEQLHQERESLKAGRMRIQEEERLAKLQGSEAIAALKKDRQDLSRKLEGALQEGDNLRKEISSLQKQAGELKALAEKDDNSAKENSSLKAAKAAQEAEAARYKKMYAKLEEKSKELYLKLKLRESDDKEAGKLGRTLITLTNEYNKLNHKNEALRKKLSNIENTFGDEKAALYYELGSAYMEARIFDMALESFKKSLEYNSKNADTHYKLGLLYKHSRNNDKKAIYHFRKYLEMNPQAENRADVEYLISMLAKKDY